MTSLPSRSTPPPPSPGRWCDSIFASPLLLATLRSIHIYPYPNSARNHHHRLQLLLQLLQPSDILSVKSLLWVLIILLYLSKIATSSTSSNLITSSPNPTPFLQDNLKIYMPSEDAKGRPDTKIIKNYGEEITFFNWGSDSSNLQNNFFESKFKDRNEACKIVEIDFWENVEKYCINQSNQISDSLLHSESSSSSSSFRYFKNFRVLHPESADPKLLLGFDILGGGGGGGGGGGSQTSLGLGLVSSQLLGYWFTVQLQGISTSHGSDSLIEIAGRVVDHWNGDYSVYFSLPYYGHYNLTLTLDYDSCDGYPRRKKQKSMSLYRGNITKSLYIIYDHHSDNRVKSMSSRTGGGASAEVDTKIRGLATSSMSSVISIAQMLADTGHYIGGMWIVPHNIPATCANDVILSKNSEVTFVGDSTTGQIYRCLYFEQLLPLKGKNKRCHDSPSHCQMIIDTCGNLLTKGTTQKKKNDAAVVRIEQNDQLAWRGILGATDSKNTSKTSILLVMGPPNHNPLAEITKFIFENSFVKADKYSEYKELLKKDVLFKISQSTPLVLVVNVGLHLMANLDWSHQKEVLKGLTQLPVLFPNVIGPNEEFNQSSSIKQNEETYFSTRPVQIVWRDTWALHEHCFWKSASATSTSKSSLRTLVHLSDPTSWLHHSFTLATYSKTTGTTTNTDAYTNTNGAKIQFLSSYWLAKAHKKSVNDTDMRHHDIIVVGSFLKHFLGSVGK